MVVSRRLLYILPLSVFLLMTAYFALGLTKDPKIIPSALIDKPVPVFSLPPIAAGPGGTYRKGFSSADLRGRVSVVNVFASWCYPCRAEHPVIQRLAAMKVAPVYGLNYKDRPGDALRWLRNLGDPYTAIGADFSGRVGIDWGVYGVPETFIVGPEGRIRHKHTGPLDDRALEREILPVIRSLAE
ncbi:MAG: DsbE family thiol:disulfide interchange protein [Rhodospirillales bacterium]